MTAATQLLPGEDTGAVERLAEPRAAGSPERRGPSRRQGCSARQPRSSTAGQVATGTSRPRRADEASGAAPRIAEVLISRPVQRGRATSARPWKPRLADPASRVPRSRRPGPGPCDTADDVIGGQGRCWDQIRARDPPRERLIRRHLDGHGESLPGSGLRKRQTGCRASTAGAALPDPERIPAADRRSARRARTRSTSGIGALQEVVRLDAGTGELRGRARSNRSPSPRSMPGRSIDPPEPVVRRALIRLDDRCGTSADADERRDHSLALYLALREIVIR